MDYEDCRYAVQQLNLYLDGAQEKPRPPGKEELDLLKNREWFGLDDGELAEVQRDSFTPLDAHHLDLCLLLQDAVRSLRLDRLAPREQARACFDWVMRQVQLRDRAGDALPPDFVLRRGWGTALERAQIFLAVLQQLSIDGCMLAVPGKPDPLTEVRSIASAEVTDAARIGRIDGHALAGKSAGRGNPQCRPGATDPRTGQCAGLSQRK